jgi:serine/threonine protein kinase
LSPEQAEAKPVDPRSDVFSLGVLIFEMATSQRPFKGDTQVSLLSSIIKDTPSSLTDLKADLPVARSEAMGDCARQHRFGCRARVRARVTERGCTAHRAPRRPRP